MNPPETRVATPRERANRLYWESDQRVDDVATELGMSRSAVYNSIEPIPAGVACDECGGPTEYPNRSRRTAGEASCPDCGVITRVPVDVPAAEPAPEAGPAPDPQTDSRAGFAALPRGRAVRIGGAVVVGAALGFAATRVLRGAW